MGALACRAIGAVLVRCSRQRCAPVLLVLALLAPSATMQAVPLTFNFTGTVLSASGIFLGQGSTVTGSYVYDSGLVDLVNPGSGNQDQFEPIGANNGLLFEISVLVGSVARTTAGNDLGGVHHFLRLNDNSSFDRFFLTTNGETGSDDVARISLMDTLAPLDGIAAGFGNLTGTPLLVPPNPLLFDNQANLYRSRVAGSTDGEITFTITSIVLPEPASGLLLGLAVVGLTALGRRAR